MAEINPVEQYFLQKTSEASYGLWNAILTINGILVSAFSLAIAFSGNINVTIAGTLVSFCCISMLLILWNYISTKNHYLKVGKRLSNPSLELTETEKASDLATSIKRHKWNIYREKITFLFLLIEIILVTYISFCGRATT